MAGGWPSDCHGQPRTIWWTKMSILARTCCKNCVLICKILIFARTCCKNSDSCRTKLRATKWNCALVQWNFKDLLNTEVALMPSKERNVNILLFFVCFLNMCFSHLWCASDSIGWRPNVRFLNELKYL